jgi:hypothetical protein
MKSWIVAWGLVVGSVVPSWAQVSPFSEEEKTFLAALEEAIEMHDWLALLDWSDPEHRAKQTGGGMGHAQYVAELVGLFYDGNSIAGEDGKVTQEDLTLVKQVQWKRKGPVLGNGAVSVFGTATLTDGQTLLLEIQLKKTADGKLVLTGAMG